MTEDNHKDKDETLGEFLRRSRKERDISFDHVLKETKIPKTTLQAMEADDYALLPADAFARGFYGLYAKCLKLDSEDVLQRYDRERTGLPAGRNFDAPSKQEKRVNTMAARPSAATGAIFAFSLVVIIAGIALLCWYFSWNPATFISSKLQSFQEPPATEMQGESASENGAGQGQPGNLIETNYFLTVDFLEATTITITIDNGLPEKESYAEGSTRSWYADESISMILPETADVEVFFNGSLIDLPAAQNGFIFVELP